MPLTGTLQDLSLPSLVQLQSAEQRQTQVRLNRGGAEGMLYFAGGELVHASLGRLTGADAVYELLTWEDGNFVVTEDVQVPEPNVDVPWSSLLLEGLRRLDEVRAERDSAVQAALQQVRRQPDVHGVLLVNAAGVIRGEAADGDANEKAALVAFVATRGEAIGALLEAGRLAHLVCTLSTRKIWVERIDSNYIGCWLDQRATPRSIKPFIESVPSSES